MTYEIKTSQLREGREGGSQQISIRLRLYMYKTSCICIYIYTYGYENGYVNIPPPHFVQFPLKNCAISKKLNIIGGSRMQFETQGCCETAGVNH